MKCTDSNVSLVPARSLYVHENFHYNNSCQNSFCCCNVIFVFMMGNRFLHIYVEAVIYQSRSAT